MSENDSQRPQDAGNAGETQQQPRAQVESTPADGNNIPYVQAYDTQTGKPLGGQQVVNKHTVVKTKTKKLPIFITALAGCACGALLVIALIMSGTLNIGGGKNAVTAGASGSSTQKISIDSEDTTLAEAVSAKALPSVVSITATSSGGQNGSLSQSADESDGSGSVGSGVVLDTEGHILTNNHVVDGYDQYVVTMDDGTTYEITDLRLWEEPEPLPVLTRNWPELELPKAEVRRFQSEHGDNLHIRNLYETRRMEYTIYNAAMNCPELWKDGVPTLNLHLGISAQNAVQMFWPWQEDQLTQVFCSAPGARFEVEAWDVYHDGKYLYTEYNIRGT